MSSEGKYIGHLTPETIREYLGGQLDSTKMHQIETHLLECEFCADAVEGFELSERSHVKTDQALLALRKKLNQKIKEHERPRMMRWPAWSAAAGIALAIAGYVVIKQQEREQELLAIQQSEAFLQTGINDTLIIFMPEDPRPVNPEGLLASNTGYAPQPGEQHAEAAALARDSRAAQAATAKQDETEKQRIEHDPTPDSQIAQAAGAPREGTAKPAAAARQVAAVQQQQMAERTERILDSLPAGNELARAVPGNRAVVVKSPGVQRKPPRTGKVYIRGVKRDTAAEGMKTIRGRVVAGDTMSLPGVSVTVEGTSKSTSTDHLGNFTLQIPKGEHSLVMSMIGFKTDTVRVAEYADNLLLAMQPAEMDLNEVIVVGYSGNSKKAGQVSPTPVIGKAAYEKYLADSLRYPEEALEKQAEGEVVVSFTVRASGRPAAFKIIRSLGYGCDKEAIRLIKEGPDWVSPVVKRGRPQPAEAVQTVKFNLP
ncbi:TonB family protein [Anseongella ginsenosidimutans]|uniref:TonB family protein n=1 Tax=Anseongella ginsenosidimutans TaxID=496056 RepID=A0A4R3KWR9_9SPHI|nr:TonB family protein [Anseongella ginsenosidimutans]QEC51451.1 TonB family protein [Anseongella ginsenosidimutans]TCS89841.1 TonB family protein [Anseongella ginsenosidimutans]